MKNTIKAIVILAIMAAAIVLAFTTCEGPAGADGADGQQGAQGPTGGTGPQGPAGGGSGGSNCTHERLTSWRIDIIPENCTDKNLDGRYCLDCGYAEYREGSTNALGHLASTWTTATIATCTAAEIQEGMCDRPTPNGCGGGLVTRFNGTSLGHSVSTWTNNTATCTTAGTEQGMCDRPTSSGGCGGDLLTRDTAALGHQISVALQPTETTDGRINCTRSGCPTQLTLTIPAWNKYYGTWKNASDGIATITIDKNNLNYDFSGGHLYFSISDWGTAGLNSNPDQSAKNAFPSYQQINGTVTEVQGIVGTPQNSHTIGLNVNGTLSFALNGGTSVGDNIYVRQ
jgi:hypothetical protein